MKEKSRVAHGKNSNSNKNCYFVTTEYEGILQVGGLGHFSRFLPTALSQYISVSVLIPGYTKILESPDLAGSMTVIDEFYVNYKHKRELVKLIRLDKYSHDNLSILLFANSNYFGESVDSRYSGVYVYSEIPYLDDALRMSFFSAALFKYIKNNTPDYVHANDWFFGLLFFLLKENNISCTRLLTLHNVLHKGRISFAYANTIGIDLDSFVEARMEKNKASIKISNYVDIIELFKDPLYLDCINLLSVSVKLAHRINTVSPNYLKEIVNARPSSFSEGLEYLFKLALKEGRFYGILNGINYLEHFQDSSYSIIDNDSKSSILDSHNHDQKIVDYKKQMHQELIKYFINSNKVLLGFVGRADDQKFGLFKQEFAGKSLFEHILNIPNVNFVVLANKADHNLHVWLSQFTHYSNLKYFFEFDREKALTIIAGVDFLLVPSVFEPCGLVQMEAMQFGTIPIINKVGGLSNTVNPYPRIGTTGFGVSDKDLKNCAVKYLKAVEAAIKVKIRKKKLFNTIVANATKKRFTWQNAAKKYLKLLYEIG